MHMAETFLLSLFINDNVCAETELIWHTYTRLWENPDLTFENPDSK